MKFPIGRGKVSGISTPIRDDSTFIEIEMPDIGVIAVLTSTASTRPGDTIEYDPSKNAWILSRAIAIQGGTYFDTHALSYLKYSGISNEINLDNSIPPTTAGKRFRVMSMVDVGRPFLALRIL